MVEVDLAATAPSSTSTSTSDAERRRRRRAAAVLRVAPAVGERVVVVVVRGREDDVLEIDVRRVLRGLAPRGVGRGGRGAAAFFLSVI